MSSGNFEQKVLEVLRWQTDKDIGGEINNTVKVSSTNELPPVSNGRHQLEDGTSYKFIGEVESENGLELNGSSPLIGNHRETDWFIYTGGGTAVTGTDADYIQTNMSINATGGTVFSLNGATDSECIIDSSFLADDQNRGNISDLGTVEGFRSPTFNQLGVRDFDSGLTFTGTTGRVSIDDCIVRDIIESGVTAFTFDADFTADNVTISNSFTTDVQSDTEVVRVNASATINEIFEYIGNGHESSVTKSNILTGAAGVGQVGYSVTDAFPLADSTAVGELSADSVGNTITIGSQNTWVEIDDFATSEGADVERFQQSSNGTLQYIGKSDKKIFVSVNMTLITGGDTVSITISKNGTRQDSSLQETQSAAGVPIPTTVSAVTELTTDDEVEVQIRNDDSSSNITARTFNLNTTAL